MISRCLMSATALILIGIGSHGRAADGTFYVHSPTARVLQAPLFDAPVVGTVARGFSFASLGRKGNWHRLAFQGKDGYLSAMAVASTPPVYSGVLVRETAEGKPSARTRLGSGQAVVAGVKGLTYEDRLRMPQGEGLDYGALERMERLSVTEEEVDEFRKGMGQ